MSNQKDVVLIHVKELAAALDRAVISSVRLVFFYPANRNQNFWFVKVSTKTDQNS